MYSSGHGVTKDEEEAVRWYHLAAYQGLPEAQLAVGIEAMVGELFRDTPEREGPEKWFRLAADQGLAEAQYWLGEILEPGNSSEAVNWYRLAADQGHTLAQENLAEMYRSGHGVQASDVEALKWTLVSSEECRAEVVEAKQGHILDVNEITCLDLLNGPLTPDQMDEALKLADEVAGRLAGTRIEPLELELIFPKHSAEFGEHGIENEAAPTAAEAPVASIVPVQAVAVIEQGLENVTSGPLEDGLAAYDQGDYATALKLLRPLAEQGHAKAQGRLGDMYQNGNGVPWNFAEALVWHKRAAEQGEAHAQYALGRMYDSAQGVPQDATEAARWFHLAAEQGNAEAQEYLAGMYLNGRGVPRSDPQFLKWYSLAAAQWPSPEWWLAGGSEGLSFYGGDGFGYSEEDLFFTLTCGGGVLSLLIASDPRSSLVAKAILDSSPFGESAARLEFGGNSLAAQIWGFTVDADDANGGWDLRMGIRPATGAKDFFKTLAEFSGAGAIRAVVAGETFDLTPRKADQHILVEFVRSCGDDRG